MKKLFTGCTLATLAAVIAILGWMAVLPTQAELTVYSSDSPSGVTATGVSVTHVGNGAVRQSTFTLTAVSVVCANGGAGTNAWGSAKLWDWPEGRVLVHGVVCDTLITIDSATLDVADGGSVAIGTAAVSDGDLGDATDIDLCAEISVDPITNAVHGQLSAAAQFDGTATAKDMYFNMNISSNDILTEIATNTVSGTVKVTWSLLGDY